MALLWMSGAGTFGFTALIKKNLFEAFHITANSMAPTIMKGDRTIANKMIFNHNNPEYGDVVLYKNPENRRGSRIKRVVALGGDTVEIKDGQLLINGILLEREPAGTKTLRMGEHVAEGDIFWESNGNARYQIFVSEQEIEEKTQQRDFGPVTVPQYHCFVMGDNRNHSEDSRQFGSLSYGELKGRFTQVYWPLKHWTTLNPQLNPQQ
jgi:signal peptidase I